MAAWVFILDVDFFPSRNLPIALTTAPGLLDSLRTGKADGIAPTALVVPALAYQT